MVVLIADDGEFPRPELESLRRNLMRRFVNAVKVEKQAYFALQGFKKAQDQVAVLIVLVGLPLKESTLSDTYYKLESFCRFYEVPLVFLTNVGLTDDRLKSVKNVSDTHGHSLLSMKDDNWQFNPSREFPFLEKR